MTLFPPGFAIKQDGQNFKPLGFCQHITKAGAAMQVIEWETNCPMCGVEFITTSLMIFETPTRRCVDCRVSGSTVRSARRKFRRQIVGVEA